jgi:hypothetical protein
MLGVGMLNHEDARPLGVVGPAALLLEGARQAGSGVKPPCRRGVVLTDQISRNVSNGSSV